MSKVFRLDSDFLTAERLRCGEEDWKEKGQVSLPGAGDASVSLIRFLQGSKADKEREKENFKEIIIDVDENLAKEIKALDLNGHPVANVTGAERLSGVKTLDCSYCEFNVIPKWIQQLPAIEEVDLSKNCLESVEEWFLHLQTLRSVDLSDNTG